uniref:hypothetical protein n=1 Tax=Amycolatopsis sp. CA-096443 TaxID=3239919 RepID=UPI003F4965D2
MPDRAADPVPQTLFGHRVPDHVDVENDEERLIVSLRCHHPDHDEPAGSTCSHAERRGEHAGDFLRRHRHDSAWQSGDPAPLVKRIPLHRNQSGRR